MGLPRERPQRPEPRKGAGGAAAGGDHARDCRADETVNDIERATRRRQDAITEVIFELGLPVELAERCHATLEKHKDIMIELVSLEDE